MKKERKKLEKLKGEYQAICDSADMIVYYLESALEVVDDLDKAVKRTITREKKEEK